MAVVPEPIRPVQLAVDKAPPLVPHLDPRNPADRDAVQVEAILDLRTQSHPDRVGGEHLEAKPRRGDSLQVARLREEREHVLERLRQHLLSLEPMNPHAPPSTSRSAASISEW